MDNESKGFQNENWLDDILGAPTHAEEIGPDEHAVSSAGLTHPDDLELEQILAEDWDKLQDTTAAHRTAQEEATKLFAAPEVPAAPEPDAPETAVKEEPVPQKENTRTKKSPVRKGRPEAKQGYGLLGIPHLLATCIWLAIIVVVGVALGRTIWVCCADLMAFGKADQEVTITITESDTIDTVSEKLGKASLVRYPGLFKFFAELTGKEENISAGTYTLNAKLDYNAMINAMTNYGEAREEVEIMFPEGYNCAQIFKLLEEKNVCTVKELEEWAANGELDAYWFLEDVERGSKYCLEGYLFPDTYKFYVNDEPQRVLEKFLDAFDYRFTDLMKEDYELLKERYNLDLTVNDVVTVASIIEKETSSAQESYNIASVFYNRLVKGDMLGSDATVYYAIGDYFGEKDELTDADLQSSSPYNTRKQQGLPPGAICSPGRESLYAALDPNETDYYYFVYDSSAREHLFSVTYEEHQRKLRELGL